MKRFSMILGAILAFSGPGRADDSESRVRAALALAQAQASANTAPTSADQREAAQTRRTDAPAPAYRWKAFPAARQWLLFRGDVQIGAWRQDEGVYQSCESGAWVVAECPAELPKEANRPFASSPATTPGTAARTVAPIGASSPLTTTTTQPARTGTNARPAMNAGGTMTAQIPTWQDAGSCPPGQT